MSLTCTKLYEVWILQPFQCKTLQPMQNSAKYFFYDLDNIKV